MTNSRVIPWSRILAEGVAIVASILLAFAIQAWWEDRQTWEGERQILNSLLDELSIQSETLSTELDVQKAILDSTRSLQLLAVNPNAQVENQNVDSLLADLYWISDDSEWNMPTLRGALSGGNVTRISNPALRVQLADLAAWVDTVILYMRQDYDFGLNEFGPFLRQNTYMPAIVNKLDDEPGPGSQWKMDTKHPQILEYDNSQVLSNREFHNILVVKRGKQINLVHIAFPGTQQAIDETIRLIELELAQ